jgi:hypothetical protein
MAISDLGVIAYTQSRQMALSPACPMRYTLKNKVATMQLAA